MAEIDAEINALIGGLEIPDQSGETVDAFSKFQADAQLAGFIGWKATEKLASETAFIDKRAAEILAHRTTPAPAVPAVTDDVLAKMESPFDRRKRSLSVWMRSQLALGKSTNELISHAARHDAAVANLLREVAAELEAA